jgi:hypothetical protein
MDKRTLFAYDNNFVISSLPEPYVNSVNKQNPSNDSRDNHGRKTIRQIMLQAKNSTVQTKESLLPKNSPKNIPNQILDDVQLFELYYKNLDKMKEEYCK